MTEKKHHVAWADRLGYNKRWAKNIDLCNETFGTPSYPYAVDCLLVSLVNIKDGPQLRTLAENYKNVDLRNWKEEYYDKTIEENYELSTNRGWCDQKKRDIDYESYKALYTFIIQLLEDNGFCFYDSNIESEELGLDD